MTFLTAFAVAVGLAADAFAASLACGCVIRAERLALQSLIIAGLFGGAQALMPFIGWQIGAGTRAMIADWDHWIAFAILAFIGIKTIRDGFKDDEDEEAPTSRILAFGALLVTTVATSIDALAAGFGFALVEADMWLLIAVTGVVTFVLSWIGVHVGCRVSHHFGARFEMVGGVILIGIGCSILYSHLA